MPSSGKKITNLRSLLSRRSGWRRAGRQVVFTNGIFDILHRGHVEYLAQARAMGDLLIVGLNTDASTRRLKGPGRPLNKQADRAAVLAGLAAVDYVVSFRGATPLRLITTLKPDILVKGSQYRKSEIVGAGEVESWGGRVARVRMRRGLSTSALLKKAVRVGCK